MGERVESRRWSIGGGREGRATVGWKELVAYQARSGKARAMPRPVGAAVKPETDQDQ